MSMKAQIDAARDLLSGLGPISARRMFGGAGLYYDGLIFGVIINDMLHLKTDADFAAELEAQGSEPFTYTNKAGTLVKMTYWRLPDSALDDPDEAVALARRAVEISRRAK